MMLINNNKGLHRILIDGIATQRVKHVLDSEGFVSYWHTAITLIFLRYIFLTVNCEEKLSPLRMGTTRVVTHPARTSKHITMRGRNNNIIITEVTESKPSRDTKRLSHIIHLTTLCV